VKKEILAFLMSSRPWRQVVSINRWRQDVLSVKKVASRCPASSRSRQDAAYAPLHELHTCLTDDCFVLAPASSESCQQKDPAFCS